MKNENIFENAYFGKEYKTRCGTKAIFITKMNGKYNFSYRLIIEGNDYFSNYDINGRMYPNELPNDIVSEWNNTSFNTTSDEIIKYAEKTWEDNDYVVAILPLKEKDIKPIYMCAFEDGYNEALKNINID